MTDIVSKHLKTNEKYMKEALGIGVSYDVSFREILVLERNVQLYYVNGLVSDDMATMILRQLVEINDEESEEDNARAIIKNRLINLQVTPDNEFASLIDELLSGLIIVFIDGVADGFVIDVRQYPGRSPEEPDTERVIRGSRDGFTESIVENMGLTRRRVKDKNLRNEIFTIGTRSKTDVSISYISDITNDDLIRELKEKLEKIDIDGLVMADKALEELIFDKKWNPFPAVRYTERPDVAAHHILSGYIVVMVDTSPTVMIMPTTFFDHLEHAEEFRQTPSVGTFTRWIRILGVLVSLYLLPIWLLFVLHPELLPKAISFIGPDEVGNIPIAIQIIVAITGVELLRMAAVHTPTPLATALGLIAAVLIGDIAIQVGLFTPEVILYVALSTVGAYVTPSYELSVANKFIHLFLILMIISFGVSGFIIGFTLIIIYLMRINHFHTPYLWPLLPFNFKAMSRFILRIPAPFVRTRPSIVHPKDSVRQQMQKE